MRTFSPKDKDITHQWHVIDATDVVLGRLASHVAVLLRGKHKPIFAPHVDTGDFVIVVNADKIALSGAKLEQKKAYRHSGYPGGLRSVAYGELMAKRPEPRGGEGRQGHAAEELTWPQDADQAQGLRGPGSPAPGPAAAAVRDPADFAVIVRGGDPHGASIGPPGPVR